MTPRLVEYRCICCEHPVSATTPDELRRAMQAHADYINQTVDRRHDPYFEDMRLSALVEQ